MDFNWLEGFEGGEDGLGDGRGYENYKDNSDYQGQNDFSNMDWADLFGGGGLDFDSLLDGFFKGGDGVAYDQYASNALAGLGGDSDGNGVADAFGNNGYQAGDAGALGGNWYDGLLKDGGSSLTKMLLGTNKDGSQKGLVDALMPNDGGTGGLLQYMTPALATLLAGNAVSNNTKTAGPAPDYAGMVNPALGKLQAGAAEQAKFLNDSYDWLKPVAQNVIDTSKAVSDEQRGYATKLGGLGNDQIALYQKNFQPVQERAALDASGYSYLSAAEQEAYDKANGRDTEANRLLRNTQSAAENFAANQAGTSVDQNFANQRAEANRRLAEMGVNPNSGRSIGLANRDMDIAQAVGKSGAEFTARTGAKESGIKQRNALLPEARGVLAGGAGLVDQAVKTGTNATSVAGAGLDAANKVTGIKNAAFDATTKGNAAAVDVGLKLGDLSANQWRASNASDQAEANGYGKLFGGLGEGVLRYFQQNKA